MVEVADDWQGGWARWTTKLVRAEPSEEKLNEEEGG